MLAHTLATRSDISTYLVDIRGHGLSDGPRGDAPSPEQVWQDVNTVASEITNQSPSVPVFLGGHSSGAGLLINYANSKYCVPTSGYLFIAPELGPFANTKRASRGAEPFVRINQLMFLLNGVSGGKLCGHRDAVHFNYPEVLKNEYGLLTSYTVNMSKALTPQDPRRLLSRISAPIGIWVGERDELLDPDKLKRFADSLANAPGHVEVITLAGESHLSILINVSNSLAQWMRRRVNVLD